MIGNDIVDLTAPQAREKSRDTRFMGRVFTPAERRLIRDSDDPDCMLWSLWAGKETAYKAIRRRFPAVSSAPGRYEVRYTDNFLLGSGTVYTPRGAVSIRLFLADVYVHCIGATEDADVNAIVWDVQEIPRVPCSPDESDFVRTMTKRSISVFLGEQPEAVDIIRAKEDHGLTPPVVKIRDTFFPLRLSMSHDGRFAACAFSTYRARPDTPPFPRFGAC
ncbi:MAG: 4'-phosphopantetheinyl transferase superfamily protein [Deltaproteobacteria bacterium]|nr:4'-phosphopantetheinyl transferase superfamily protein [Deltaproteobacteria bacterium]